MARDFDEFDQEPGGVDDEFDELVGSEENEKEEEECQQELSQGFQAMLKLHFSEYIPVVDPSFLCRFY